MDTSPDAITEHVQPLLKTNERIEQLWPLHGEKWLLITDRNILTLTLSKTNEIDTVTAHPSGKIEKLSVSETPKPTTPYYATAGVLAVMSVITVTLGVLISTAMSVLSFVGAIVLAVTSLYALYKSRGLPTGDVTHVAVTFSNGTTETFEILGNQTPEVLKSRLRQTF